MRLNKGSILIETLVALIVVMIMTQTILSLYQLDIIEKKIMDTYEKRL